MSASKTKAVTIGLAAAAAAGGTLCIASYLRRKRQRAPVKETPAPVAAPSPPPPTEGLPASARVLVVTRIHGQNAAQSFESGPLRAFLQAAVLYADAIAIAVDVGDVLLPRLVVGVRDVVRGFPGSPEVHVIPVSPWGKFTPALNASVSFACTHGFSHILFQSLETTLSRCSYERLRAAFDPHRDLVVGAALQGHDFCPGLHVLSGVTSPWNTLALWCVEQLSHTGFPSIAEGLFDGGQSAGIEEVATIALLQLLHACGNKGEGDGEGCVAKLVRLEGVAWQVHWEDPGREEWHGKKMQGKVSRAQAQLKVLGIPPGRVWHVQGGEGEGR